MSTKFPEEPPWSVNICMCVYVHVHAFMFLMFVRGDEATHLTWFSMLQIMRTCIGKSECFLRFEHSSCIINHVPQKTETSFVALDFWRDDKCKTQLHAMWCT